MPNKFVGTHLANELIARLGIASGAQGIEIIEAGLQQQRILGAGTTGGTGEETVWDAAGAFPWASLATAQALEIVSSSANDTAAGTGARTVRIRGLSATYAEITEDVTLNGTTAVDLTLSYLRVFSIEVLTAGSGLVNAGTLTLRLDAAGATVAAVTIGKNISQSGVWTVPLNKQAYLMRWQATRPTTTNFAGGVYIRTFGGLFKPIAYEQFTGAGKIGSLYPLALFLPEKADIDFRVTTAASTTAVTAEADIIVEQIRASS